MKEKITIIILIVLAGCGLFKENMIIQPDFYAENPYESSKVSLDDLKKAVKKLTTCIDRMNTHARVIGVANFVNMKTLKADKNLSFLLTELTKTELSRLGYTVKEVQTSKVITVSEKEGVKILSRDIKKLNKDTEIDAILAGMYYWENPKSDIIINAHLIDVRSADIISSCYESIEVEK